MEVRPYDPERAAEIADLFLAAVHDIDTAIYSEAQKEAWAPSPPNYALWEERLELKQPYMAMIGDRVAGFIELEDDGHIDCTYVHPHYQGQGVAAALYAHLLKEAKARQITRLYVEASHVAKPFFEHLGFTTLRENRFDRHGVILVNYSMEKLLG